MKLPKLTTLIIATILLLASTLATPTPTSTTTKKTHLSKGMLYDHFKKGLKIEATPPQCTETFFNKIVPRGFVVSEYKVTTADGYILTIFRVQKGPVFRSGLPVVFLQHGIDDSSSGWFLNSENLDLSAMIVNNDFDLFLGNSRGNIFSRKHVSLTPDDPKYWQFSFQQMGYYDVPANIAKVRTITGVDKLIYIGHSQGTTQMFAALSDAAVRPKVAPYLVSYHALAPVVYFKNNKIPIINVAKYIEGLIQKQLKDFGINYFTPGDCVWDPSTISYWDKTCQDDPDICFVFIFLSDTYKDTINWSRFGYKKLLTNNGVSTDSLLHYAQLLRGRKNEPLFQKFDYGSAAVNIQHYGTATPPLYDLSLVQERVRLWHGTGDKIADFEDVTLLEGALKNASVMRFPIFEWGHNSFQLGSNCDVVYKPLIQMIKEEGLEQEFSLGE